MYLKSLVVFVLCTALVLGVAVVLNYEATSVGNQAQALPPERSSCTASDASCPSFSIVSASLRVQNTTDQLGIASPAYVSLELNVSGAAPLATVRLFVGNASAGTVPGPLVPGLDRIANFTLPTTVIVTPGGSYLLSVQGFDASGSYVIQAESVVARGQVPYSP